MTELQLAAIRSILGEPKDGSGGTVSAWGDKNEYLVIQNGSKGFVVVRTKRTARGPKVIQNIRTENLADVITAAEHFRDGTRG